MADGSHTHVEAAIAGGRVRAAAAPNAGGRPTLRERLLAPGAFVAIAELVPWRGILGDENGAPALDVGRELAADPRIAALSITDNAGGHARISPSIVAQEFVDAGREVIVHVACRDRSRSALESLGWELASRRMTNLLTISGDYPIEGYRGLSKPVFDLNSVGLLSMLSALEAELERELGAGHEPELPADMVPGFEGFFLGAAVNNHKRLEREVVPQYLKLALKIRSGADFVISQVGYDARKQDELLRFMRFRDLVVPVIANAYILSRPVARAFHERRVPGCVVTDDLLDVVERQAGSADKGRAFFLEFAARQVAIARGLGYQGVYVSGHRSADEVFRIIETADRFGADDWRTFARETRFGQPGEFYLFEEDPSTGLASDRLSRRYLRSKAPSARARARRRSPIGYRLSRLAHDRLFTPGTRTFRAAGRTYERIERYRLGRPVHVLEQMVKTPLYDCRDCGDCSLPDVAYLCPESQCAKNQRNGPCGGSHDGLCEVDGRPCVWALVYERLTPYSEEQGMLDRPVVIQDNALRRTSAWANTFRGRDHLGRRSAERHEDSDA